MTIDPYQALGVGKKASADEIKKAYRKLARQYHPDVNPGDQKSEEKFKELSMAYDILSDPGKRAEYDNLGQEAFYERGFNGAGYRQQDFNMSGFNWAEILGGLFGDQGKSARGGRKSAGDFDFGSLSGFGRRKATPARGADREYSLEMSFMDAAKGQDVKLKLKVPVICPSCGGQGRLDSDDGRNCPACKGHGTVLKSETLVTHVHPGVRDGQKFRFAGKGGQGNRGGPSGDLLLVVHVKPDEVFSRDNDGNVMMEAKVSLYLALLGGKLEIPTLTGRANLTVPPGTQNGDKLRLKGLGLPAKLGIGDLMVTFKVVLPTNLSPEAKALAEQLSLAAPLPQEGLGKASS
ncbi:MAG: DnaJ domain-containing protein [Deltaproteobacteria bacterium]|jgi:molecular chaperone DnaJ|nr:DnaJ domain-containing protein [Deltaproteobacteria bacterium]